MVIVATGFEGFSSLVRSLDENEEGLEVPVPRTWTSAASTGRTVGTRAAQVWLTRDLETLGWFRGSGIISGLGLNYDTWADMTHTLGSERAWRTMAPPLPDRPRKPVRESGEARSVAYFCGVVADDPDATVVSDLDVLLAGMESIWPEFKVREGEAIADTFALTNVEGSDRYSLSLPGTLRDRLSPLDRSVLNLTVAGDWTACGLDAGCVEAAVMSGMLAAAAITGDEKAIDAIVGYDHP